jgi:hypothetical protein
MPIRIPTEDREHLGALVRLPPAAIASIKDAIDRCLLRAQRGDLTEQLAQLIGALPDLNAPGIAKVIVSLYFLRASQDMTADAVAAEVVSAIQRSSDSRYGQLPDDWSTVRRDLTQLLSSDSTMGISTKAAFLSYQAPRHMMRARILTDARPVFATDPNSGPAAFVVTHTLQIDYHEDDASGKEWFIALDHDDLDTLEQAVTRARIKERTLRKSLAFASVPVVDVSGRSTDED